MAQQASSPVGLVPGISPVAQEAEKKVLLGDEKKVSEKVSDILQASPAAAGKVSPVVDRKAVELTPSVKAAIAELQSKLHTLTPAAQESFHQAQLEQISSIAGFQAVMAFHNLSFQGDSGRIHESVVRERWRLLREQENEQFKQTCAAHQALQEIFKLRIAALQSAIHDREIEKAILKEIIVGQSSAISLGLLKRALTYYGAPFRLDEIRTALEVRKIKLGIKSGETATITALPTDPSADSLLAKLTDLSQNMACLKEESAVIDEALRNVARDAANSSEWPKKLYVYLKSSLKSECETIEKLKQDVAERLKAIDIELTEKKAEEEIRSCKKEKAEIQKRWDRILQNEKDTSLILTYIKKAFFLEDQDGIIDFDDFSEVYGETFNLLTLITSHREQVVLGNTWEPFLEPAQRKAVYYKDIEKAAEYEEKKKKLDEERVKPHMQLLDAAVQTYGRYIQSLQLAMNTADSHIKFLSREAQTRAKWQVDAPEEKAKKSGGSPQKAEREESALVSADLAAAEEKK